MGLALVALGAVGCGSSMPGGFPDGAVADLAPGDGADDDVTNPKFDRQDAQFMPVDQGGDAARTDMPPPPPREFPIYAHDPKQLFLVNPPDFDLQVIGSFGVDDDMTDIAITPTGELYTISNTALYAVDKQTAQATKIVDLMNTGGGIPASNVALTFLSGGDLLASDQTGGVRKINPTTGVVEEIGAFGDGLATAGDLVAIADGTIFGISDEGAPDAADNNILIKVNPTTGKGTRIGQIGYGQVWGMAYNGGRVYAFTNAGEIIEINPSTGAGTLKRKHDVMFWGAGVTPLVRPQG